ncbi:MAG: hypothetical protein MR858_20055, partial [Shigella flexneri]|nr:hypothetical protein [Shigella flexneri]
AGLGAHQPNRRLRLAAEPQTGRREVSALTDARKTLAYDFFRILRAPLYSAIPVNRTLCALYAMTGLASAVAAVLLVSYFGSARSDLGASFLMPAITAVVLGGANIYGGSGSIIGTAIAVLLVGYLQQGLQMAGVPNQVSSALSGALLIVVVVGRSVSLHRQQIKEWLARRANNPLP